MTFAMMAGLHCSLLISVMFSLLYCICPCQSFEWKHHDNQELAAILENIHADCPNITRVYTLSETSVAGSPLLLIEFSDLPGKHEISKCVSV